MRELHLGTGHVSEGCGGTEARVEKSGRGATFLSRRSFHLNCRSASEPEPTICPPVDPQLNDSGSLSRSLATAVMCTRPPGCTELGLAEQLIVAGRFGRGSTRTTATQLTFPPRPSSTRAVTEWVPGATPAGFHRTCEPIPSMAYPWRIVISGKHRACNVVTS
jgi:hypothetical protein